MADGTHERWLAHPDWIGYYEVSDQGQVRSIDRFVLRPGRKPRLVQGCTLSQSPDADGYLHVGLSRHGRTVTRSVHRLVLETFTGPCPAGQEGCHWDDIPGNNHLGNLRWDTHSANQRDKARNGTNDRSNRTHCPLEHRLVTPNLVPSALRRNGGRNCLACGRAHSAQGYAASRGYPFDFRAAADEYYRKIMQGA